MAIDHYAVLVLPDQDLDDERQLAFAANFGEIEAPRSARADVKRRLRPEISDISNLDENNRLRAAKIRVASTSSATGYGIPTARSVACRRRCRCFMRTGRRLSGGETEFSDLRAAWDALPEKTKAGIEDLVAMHDIAHSRAQIGFTELLFGEREALPAVPQRLVRAHPGSEAQDALSRLARLAYPRPAGAGGPFAAARPDRVRDRAALCLPSRMAEGRSSDLG